MKTKQEAKKEALAYAGELIDKGHYIVNIATQSSRFTVATTCGNRFFEFDPLIKDAPYQVWDGDTKPKQPCMYYYSGEGMDFYASGEDYKTEADCMEWEYCEKMEVGR